VKEIEWAPRAARTMFDIFDYLSASTSEESAVRTVDAIYAAVDLLEDNPRLGRASEAQSRRELVVGDHIVMYQAKRGSIRVMKVEHGR
jgi:plasmid stabilization system protein ParE